MEKQDIQSVQAVWDVLLVDDDQEDFLLTRAALHETAGSRIQLHWSSTYEEGMQLLAEQHFDAILVDYRLLEQDGLNFIREAIQAGYNAPFILLTGQNSYDLDMAAMQAGAVDYLSKSDVNPFLLERSLRYAIERHRLLEENRQQRILFQTVFEVNPAGVAIVSGQDMTFKLVNPSYRLLTPHPELDPLGRTIDEIWSPVETFHGSMSVRYILEHGQPVRVDRSDFVYPDGSRRSLAFDLQPYLWQGQPAVLIVGWDITQLQEARVRAEKAAEEAERRASEAEEGRRVLQAIMEYLPEGLAIAEGAQGSIRMVSKYGMHQAGLIDQSSEGLPIERYPEKWHIEYPDRQAKMPVDEFPLARALRTGEVIEQQEIALRQPDGSRVLISCNAAPIRDGEGAIIGGLIAWRDISESRQASERLAYQACLLENVHDAIIATDDNFLLTSWNRAAEELYGWNAEEVLGRRLGEVIRSEINSDLFRSALEDLSRKDYYRLEIPQYTRTGQRIVVDNSVIALRDAEGHVTGYINASRDITSRIQASQERERLLREVEQQQARLSALIDNAPVGIFVADRESKVLLANPAGERLLGGRIPPDEPFYEYADHFWTCRMDGTRYEPRDLPLVRSAMYAETFENLELQVNWADGQQRHWLINCAPIRSASGEHEGAVAIVQDITDRRRTAEVLQRNAAQMEAQRYLTRAREMERLNIAHDLHDGPIQEMIGITYRLSEAQSMGLNEEIAGVLDTIQAEMQRMIGGMRAFCNELRPPALTPFGLERAIRSHAEAFRSMHPELTLHLDLERDGQALPEQVRIAMFQVFRESLNNIVKHARASEVNIQLRLIDGEVRMQIRDNGRGFQLPYHWVEFAREGHLGLVGMQERAESVGGQVRLSSAPGHGTTLQVSVPYHQQAEILQQEN